jgi:ribonuclease R
MPLRRDAVLDLLAREPRGLRTRDLADRLGLQGVRRHALDDLLSKLAEEGVVSNLPGERVGLREGRLPKLRAELEGAISVNARGFGFVSIAGRPEDIFVPGESLGGAMHGDTVAVRVVGRSERGVEGAVTRVVTRRSARVAGTLRRRGKSIWLEPDDARIRGPIVLRGEGDKTLGKDGEAAVVRITRFPDLADENPEGTIEAILGTPGEPKVEVAKILAREGVEEDHPESAVAEAEAYGGAVSDDAIEGREDLTHLPLPTIDPEDARDHDDALWVERTEEGGYRAWIAIADVSHYVRPTTALDAAALERGTSIYLPDRAIPMLPRALSSNLCSLLPGVVRLCLSIEVELDATGLVLRSRVFEGFMRSAAKLTYQGVARTLGFSSNPERSEAAEALREGLFVLADLARVLRAKRMRRGALDFELPEAKLLLDAESGAPTAVEKRTQDPGIKKAYQLVEELMLLANETVATWLVERDVPTIFRVHAKPDEGKLSRFSALCHELGVDFDLEDAEDPKALSRFLKKVANHPRRSVLDMLLLRAMKQAQYDIANVGHFGLASTAYLHFTSPIRRYPDLVVHRAVRAVLRKDPVDRGEAAVEALRSAATKASSAERRAMEVEREVVDLYRAIYMRDRLGETFEGTVTAIVASGVYVNLDAPFVAVLVRTDALGPDRYEPDDEGLRLVGVRSGERIGLGDPMAVLIEDVAVLRRTIYGRRVVERVDADRTVQRPPRLSAPERKSKGSNGSDRKRFKASAREKPSKKRR